MFLLVCPSFTGKEQNFNPNRGNLSKHRDQLLIPANIHSSQPPTFSSSMNYQSLFTAGLHQLSSVKMFFFQPCFAFANSPRRGCTSCPFLHSLLKLHIPSSNSRRLKIIIIILENSSKSLTFEDSLCLSGLRTPEKFRNRCMAASIFK